MPRAPAPSAPLPAAGCAPNTPTRTAPSSSPAFSRGTPDVRFVVFGLTISSSWGNGHATPWRGLCRALAARGHQVTFFERDTSYYAAHRDAPSPAGCDLRIYAEWDDVAVPAREALARADVGIVTSYCPDARAASDLIL